MISKFPDNKTGNKIIFNASGNFSPPPGVGLIYLTMIGGGGGGAGHNGGGGGGGEIRFKIPIIVEPGVYPVTVGSGGLGSVDAGGSTLQGGNGGSSIFGSSGNPPTVAHLSCSGGQGGFPLNLGGYGGNGGLAQNGGGQYPDPKALTATITGGTLAYLLRYAGGDVVLGYWIPGTGGGYCSSGAAYNGGSVSYGIPGGLSGGGGYGYAAGGGAGFDVGGNGGSTSNGQSPNANTGAGAGGGPNGFAGGNGASGVIIVEWVG
jgi:hypothetical protein